MKKVWLFCMTEVVLLLLLLSGGQPLFGQSKEQIKAQNALKVKERIDTKAFTIDVNRAHPTSGQSIYLTSAYSLEIKGDTVVSYLPYYGRAYSIPYGGGNGLRFKAPLTGYSLKYNKKETAEIKFSVRTNEDTHNFTLEIHPDGTAFISLSSANRQSISFYGELNTEKKE